MSSPPRLFDRRLRRLRLARAAAGFEEVDFLHRRAAQDIALRLEPIMRPFPLAVDLAARRGAFAEALAASPARERIGLLIQADESPAMLAGRPGPRVAIDPERLPFAEASLDLIVSALDLHWTNDVVGALIQARRALRPDGLFIAAFLGGATLTELRQCLIEAETELSGGAGPRVSPFADPADGASLLQRAGFALPVADVDRVSVRYDHPMRLMSELRRMAETSALTERAPPLRRDVLARACALYAERFAQADGRIPASFEILTLTGWAPSPDQPERVVRKRRVDQPG